MPWLDWIPDESLEREVSALLDHAVSARRSAEEDFGKNVIDPFAAVFEISGFRLDYKSWIQSETARQAQKTLQNHIGDFHQNILGSCSGWENLHTGNVIDLVCPDKMIIAEVKNKFNTISGGKLGDLYYSLDALVSPKASIYKGFTAYYVAIIPKKPSRYDVEFTPSDKDKGARCPVHPQIREIDGASFYHLVTGEKDALRQMFIVLPDVIESLSHGQCRIESKDELLDFFNKAYL